LRKLSDTTPEAEQVLRDVLRQMPFERKWRQMGILYHTGKMLHAAGMRSRAPGATPEQVQADWAAQAGLAGAPAPRGDPLVFGSEDANRVVEHVVGVLGQLNIPHALSGSWASSIHGKMRFTHDADLCVQPFPGKEDAFCAALGDDYDVSPAAVRQAIRACQ